MLGFGKKAAFSQVEQWVDVIRVAIANAILLESGAVDDRERGIVATMANLLTCSPNAKNSEEEKRLALERLPSILSANQDVRHAAVVCLRACSVTRGVEYSVNAIQWIDWLAKFGSIPPEISNWDNINKMAYYMAQKYCPQAIHR